MGLGCVEPLRSVDASDSLAEWSGWIIFSAHYALIRHDGLMPMMFMTRVRLVGSTCSDF